MGMPYASVSVSMSKYSINSNLVIFEFTFWFHFISSNLVSVQLKTLLNTLTRNFSVFFHFDDCYFYNKHVAIYDPVRKTKWKKMFETLINFKYN